MYKVQKGGVQLGGSDRAVEWLTMASTVSLAIRASFPGLPSDRKRPPTSMGWFSVTFLRLLCRRTPQEGCVDFFTTKFGIEGTITFRGCRRV